MAIIEGFEAEGKALGHVWERADLLKPNQDKLILAEVLQNFSRAEQWMGGSQLPMIWKENEQVFLARVPKKNWEGTPFQRSALGFPLVLQHVTSINAHVMDEMFADEPPFDFHPKSRLKENESRGHKEILGWIFDKAGVQEEMESGSDECLRDGTGIWKVSRQKHEGYLCPTLEHVEREQVYVPAGFRKPNLRKAPWVIHVIETNPEDLGRMRGMEGYNIPSDIELQMLGVLPAETTPQAHGQEMDFGLSAEVAKSQARFQGDSAHPKRYPLELLEYTEADNIYTILNRKLIIRKVKQNNFDRVMWLSAFFIRVRGAFDGLGISYLAGPFQRLKQGVINALLDALALSIFGMFKRKRGAFVFPQQQRVSPGRFIDVDDMKDLERLDMPEPNNQAYTIASEADSWAAQATGAQEAMVQGIIPAGGTGGTMRTAEGAERLGNAAQARIRQYVKTLEKQVLIPYMEFCVRSNVRYLKPALLPEILDDETLQSFGESHAAILKLGPKIKFQCIASTKMRKREAAKEAMGTILPLLQNEAMQASLKGQQKKVDWNEVLNIIIKDIAGWPTKSSLIVDMTDEEVTMMMSENELLKELAVLRAKTQVETESQIQQIDAENSGRMVRDYLKSVLEKAMADGASEQELGMLKGMIQGQDKYAAMANQQQAQQPQGGVSGQGQAVNRAPQGAGNSGAQRSGKGNQVRK